MEQSPEQIDKTSWGPGPWQQEPDRKLWKDSSTGLVCLANRTETGHWCGYVAVTEGHPAYRQGYDGLEVSVHGGLTYAAECEGQICHTPAEGEPDQVWWLGFDCAHCDDLSPGMEAASRERGWGRSYGTYRTLEYVEAECVSLAQQLADPEFKL